MWFTSTKVRDYLATVISSSGQFQFPGVSEGRLFGWPLAATQNVPTNLGGSSNQSEIYLVDMDAFLIGQSLIEIHLGTGMYKNSSGTLCSAFDRDENSSEAGRRYRLFVALRRGCCCPDRCPMGELRSLNHRAVALCGGQFFL